MAGDEYIAWLERRGRDPRQKRLIASDALDVDAILELHAYFGGTIAQRRDAGGLSSGPAIFWMRRKWVPERRIRFSAGWGTLSDQRFSQLQSARR